MANYATSALKLSDTYVNTLPWGICETAGGTTAKTVNAGTFALEAGAMVVVRFHETNTAANPTLNVSSTGAKPIYYQGAAIPVNYIVSNTAYLFSYNSNNIWDLVGTTFIEATTSTLGVVKKCDSSSASAIGTSTNVPTERDIYYGLPTINGKHDYTSSKNIYPPTGPGTSGDILTSEGTNNPIWKSASAVRDNILGVYSKTQVDNIAAAKLPLAGGTMTGNITMDNSASAQSGEPYIQWATIGTNKPYTGFAHDQSDGTFIICSMEKDTTTYGVKYYKNGLSIGGGSGNLFWKGARVATVDDIPTKTSDLTNDSGFKTTDNNYYHSSGTWSGLTYTATSNGGAPELKFTVPTATTSALGAVKVGSNITVSSGTISLTKSNVTTALGYTPPTQDTTYTFNGAVSTIKDSNLTASRALISNSSGKVAVSAVTSTELGYLDGVTSAIQTQLNNKAPAYTYGTTGLTAGSSSLAAGTLYFQYE